MHFQPQHMEQLPTILGALILAGVLWIAKTVSDHSVLLAELTTTLTGKSGNNGLQSEVKGLRDKAHAHGDAIHALNGRADVVDLRLNQIDQQLSA